jgi:hypothetical protein
MHQEIRRLGTDMRQFIAASFANGMQPGSGALHSNSEALPGRCQYGTRARTWDHVSQRNPGASPENPPLFLGDDEAALERYVLIDYAGRSCGLVAGKHHS